MTKSNNNQEEMGSQNISCDRIRIDNLLNDEERIRLDELTNSTNFEIIGIRNIMTLASPAQIVAKPTFKQVLMKNTVISNP